MMDSVKKHRPWEVAETANVLVLFAVVLSRAEAAGAQGYEWLRE